MNQHNDAYLYEDIEIGAFLKYLWSRRGVVVASGAACAFLVGLIVFAIFALSPVRRNTEQPFRLAFDGASKNQYPSGLRFGVEDIVDPVILTQVWEANKLSDYVSLEQFLRCIYVTRKDLELSVIDSEIESRLRDAKVSPVDRERIVVEYQDRRRKLLEKTALVIVFSETVCERSVPVEVKLKVLRDVLTIWAEHVDKRKGALKFQVSLMSENVLADDAIGGRDYIITFDRLRNFISKTRKGAEELLKLPHGSVVRERSGSNGTRGPSVPELILEIDMLEKHRLVPLIGLIRDCGLGRDNLLSKRYLDQRMLDVKLEHQRNLDAQKVLVDALQQYVTERPQNTSGGRGGNGNMIGSNGGEVGSPGTVSQISGVTPQINESFFDKLINLSSVGIDRKYKQEMTERFITEGLKVIDSNHEVGFYENLSQSSSENLTLDTNQLEACKKQVESELAAIQAELREITRHTNHLYEELSATVLSPKTSLYFYDEPGYVNPIYIIQPRKLLIFGGVAFVLLWGSSVTLVLTVRRDR